MSKTTDRPTWKNNGLIQGRHNQVELIRSDKYDYRGVTSIVIRGPECEEIAEIVMKALAQQETNQ